MNSCVTSINDLPAEVLALICLSYAKSEGHARLCSVLSKVSKLWQDAVLHPKIWEEVSFVTRHFQHGYSWLKDRDVLQRLSMMRTLNLYSFHAVPRYFSDTLNQILENSSNLENFNYIGNHETFSVLCPSTLCSNVKRIRLKFVNFKLSGPYTLGTWLETYSINLTSISLYHACFEKFNNTLLSLQLARCCPNITHLVLDTLDQNYLFDLNAVQAGCPKMRELSLICIPLSGIDDSKSCFRYLRKFRLQPQNHVFYSKVVQGHILCALRGSSELEELDVRDINVSMNTLLQLPCKNLKSLRFKYHSFRPHGLYESLCHWRHSFSTLDVSCSSQSKQSLFQYLEEYGKDNLESLRLCIFSTDVTELKEIVRQCAKLNYFSFENAPSSNEKKVLSTRQEITEWLNH